MKATPKTLLVIVLALAIILIGLLVVALSMPQNNHNQGQGNTTNESTSKLTQADGVPDRYLKIDVEDYIYENDIEANYTFVATHAYDKASAIDSVKITLDFAYEFGTETFVGTCNYQYDSTSNNWSKIGDVRWSDGTEKLDKQAYEKTHSGTTIGLQWKVDISELDLQNGTITCDVELMNSDGKVYRTDGFDTYSFKNESFDMNVLGVTYNVYLSVHGISIFREW